MSPHGEYENLPIAYVDILPYHSAGFVFNWRLNDSFSAKPPYTFKVQHAPTCDGPWEDISGPIVDSYYWVGQKCRFGKSATHAYRVVMTDASRKSYASVPVMPYGDICMRDYLLAREIIRKETLNARKFGGTKGKLWVSASYGTRCPACLDPITGQIRNTHCRVCHGTGFAVSHYGPFDTWLQFSAEQHGAEHDDVGGTKDSKQFTVRMIGTPRVKKDDIVQDCASGRMYYVHSVSNVAEIRRIPVVQQLVVGEAATSDQAYDLVKASR